MGGAVVKDGLGTETRWDDLIGWGAETQAFGTLGGVGGGVDPETIPVPCTAGAHRPGRVQLSDAEGADGFQGRPHA